MVKDGIKRRIMVNKEVIVSAGTVNSPQLLMLSGIGPKQHLNQFNVICLSGWVLTMKTKILISINQNDWPGCLHHWFQYILCLCVIFHFYRQYMCRQYNTFTQQDITHTILTFSWSDFNILTDIKRMRYDYVTLLQLFQLWGSPSEISLTCHKVIGLYLHIQIQIKPIVLSVHNYTIHKLFLQRLTFFRGGDGWFGLWCLMTLSSYFFREGGEYSYNS